MPGSAWVEAGARVVPGRAGGCGCAEEVVLIPAINGRPVISRDDMAARGVPRTTVNGWYRERARTGHPDPVRLRLVGRALRRYRENLGYTLEDAARILDCDRSKMSRVEVGIRGIRGKELRELLAEYGIGEEEQAILAA